MLTRAPLALLAALFLAGTAWAQTPPPSPSRHTDEFDQAPGADQRGTLQRPLVVEIAPTPEGSPEAKKDAKHEHEKAEIERSLRDATWAIAGVTLALVIGTGVLAAFTFKLWRATRTLVCSAERTSREQLTHGREVNRAYLTGGGDVENGRRSFRVEVANYGKTPASLQAFDVHFAVLADLMADTQARPVMALHPFRDHVSPGDTQKMVGTVPVTNPNADVVFGAFYYEDIWQERVHEFRFILSIGQDASGRWRTRSDVDVSRLPRGYQAWD
jgi:hypothetical protein